MTVLASLLDVHRAWAWVVIIGNGLAGAWALGAHYQPALRTRALRWFTVFAELAVFVQVGLGVGMVAGQKLEAPKFHMFYGFVAIIAVGIVDMVVETVSNAGIAKKVARLKPVAVIKG